MERVTIGDLRKFLDEQEKSFNDSGMQEYYGNFNFIEVLVDHFETRDNDPNTTYGSPAHYFMGCGPCKLILDTTLGLIIAQADKQDI